MPTNAPPDEALLRAAFELAPIGVLFVNTDGSIAWPNRSFCEMVGRPRETVIGQQHTTLSHPEDRLGEQLHARELLAGSVTSYQLRKRFVRPDESVIHTLQTVHLVGTGAGTRIVAHVIDVTEQVLRASEVHTHERMRTVGRLAGSIAHDFNNVLTAIQTNAYMAAEVIGESEATEMLEDVISAAEAGARLTDRLLGFSRGGVTRSETLDLAALVQDRSPALRALAPGTRVTVDAEGPAWVFGDAQQLEQVLLNLVANARVADQVTVHVSQRWAEVCLEVADNGPGMPEAVRERAFEPYFTTRGESGGTGLGLTTVYAVVTGHQGEIHIDSAPGRGTTVRIQLPAVEAPSGEITTDLGDSINLDPRGRHLALVVDDDGPVRRAIARALRGGGCEVLEADGVSTAQARFARHGHKLSLVIADVVLRDGSGIDLLAGFRTERPGLKVLYTSGYVRKELEQNAGHSLKPMLEKPFNADDVLAAVVSLLS